MNNCYALPFCDALLNIAGSSFSFSEEDESSRVGAVDDNLVCFNGLLGDPGGFAQGDLVLFGRQPAPDALFRATGMAGRCPEGFVCIPSPAGESRAKTGRFADFFVGEVLAPICVWDDPATGDSTKGRKLFENYMTYPIAYKETYRTHERQHQSYFACETE